MNENFKRLPLLILLCGLALMFSACSNLEKEPLSTEEFSRIMTDEGFTVMDITAQFDEDSVKKGTLANSSNYQIEFYELPSAEQAKAAFNENKGNFEDSKGSSSVDKSVVLGNNGYYKLTSNETFYVVAYIDNTLLYTVVPQEYKDEVDSIVKQLGYLEDNVSRGETDNVDTTDNSSTKDDEGTKDDADAKDKMD